MTSALTCVKAVSIDTMLDVVPWTIYAFVEIGIVLKDVRILEL